MDTTTDTTTDTSMPTVVTAGYVANWHGGSSYATSYDYADSLEWFPTLSAARDAFQSRRDSGDYWAQTFRYVRETSDGTLAYGETDSVLCPTVDESAYMDLHRVGPDSVAGTLGDYMSYRLTFGPRGGVVTTRA